MRRKHSEPEKSSLIESWINESRNVIHMGASTIPSTYLLPELLPAYKSCVRNPISISIKATARAFWTRFWKAALTWGLVGVPAEDDRFCFEPFYQDQMVLITPKTAYFEELKAPVLPSTPS